MREILRTRTHTHTYRPTVLRSLIPGTTEISITVSQDQSRHPTRLSSPPLLASSSHLHPPLTALVLIVSSRLCPTSVSDQLLWPCVRRPHPEFAWRAAVSRLFRTRTINRIKPLLPPPNHLRPRSTLFSVGTRVPTAAQQHRHDPFLDTLPHSSPVDVGFSRGKTHSKILIRNFHILVGGEEKPQCLIPRLMIREFR